LTEQALSPESDGAEVDRHRQQVKWRSKFAEYTIKELAFATSAVLSATSLVSRRAILLLTVGRKEHSNQNAHAAG
jgi:hypothetical protein